MGGTGSGSRPDFSVPYTHNEQGHGEISIRPASPPNASVPIDDPALRALAEQTSAAAPLSVPAPFTAYPPVLEDYGALGEMGGKRRKMPHERAGWNEMDQQGIRKRGRRKGKDELDKQDYGGSNPAHSAGEVEADKSASPAATTQQPANAAASE